LDTFVDRLRLRAVARMDLAATGGRAPRPAHQVGAHPEDEGADLRRTPAARVRTGMEGELQERVGGHVLGQGRVAEPAARQRVDRTAMLGVDIRETHGRSLIWAPRPSVRVCWSWEGPENGRA